MERYVEKQKWTGAYVGVSTDPCINSVGNHPRNSIPRFEERLFKIKVKQTVSENDLKVVIGPMACGAAVVKNKDIVEEFT